DDILQNYAGRFRHILVDEFQDTNPAQYQLLRLLASVHGNLCVVGDDDQAIYRWRGAEVDNILDFPKHFKDTKVVRLEQNYRSSGRILAAAHAIIEKNERRAEKKLWTAAGEGEKVRVFLAEDERDEGGRIASELYAQNARGTSYAEMAVFYRANAQSRALGGAELGRPGDAGECADEDRAVQGADREAARGRGGGRWSRRSHRARDRGDRVRRSPAPRGGGGRGAPREPPRAGGRRARIRPCVGWRGSLRGRAAERAGEHGTQADRSQSADANPRPVPAGSPFRARVAGKSASFRRSTRRPSRRPCRPRGGRSGRRGRARGHPPARVPRPARARRRRGRRQRGRSGHADDAARREGPRVRRRLDDRPRGAGLSLLPFAGADRSA